MREGRLALEFSAEDDGAAAAQRPRWHRAELAAFTVVCLLCATCSGGLILGVGPFVSQLVREGFFAELCDGEGGAASAGGATGGASGEGCAAQLDAISPIFDGGFQIMTWASCGTGLLMTRVGPRTLALLGLAVSALGKHLLATARPGGGGAPGGQGGTSAGVLMLAYGLVGAGGNALYLPAFTFADLLPARHKGAALGCLAATFNLAGMAFVALNARGVTLRSLFGAMEVFTLVCAAVVAATFPARAYRPGDRFRLFGGGGACGGGGGRGGGGGWMGRGRLSAAAARGAGATAAAAAAAAGSALALQPPRSALDDDVSGNTSTSAAALPPPPQSKSPPPPPPPPGQPPPAWTWAELRGVLFSRRFLGFAFLFSWCASANVFVGGLANALASSKSPDDAAAVAAFVGWAYPLVGNATFLFSPLVGRLVDRRGFWPAFLGLVLATQLMLLACLLPGPVLPSQLLMLLLFNLVQAFAYTLQFAYITMAYRAALFGPLVAAAIGTQGLVGFVVWPGLSPNPFGPEAFAAPLLGVMLPPTLLLYNVVWRQRALEKRNGHAWSSVETTATAAGGGLAAQDHEQRRAGSPLVEGR